VGGLGRLLVAFGDPDNARSRAVAGLPELHRRPACGGYREDGDGHRPMQKH